MEQDLGLARLIIDPLDGISNKFRRDMLLRIRNCFDAWLEEIILTARIPDYLSHPRQKELCEVLRGWPEAVPFLIGLLENFSRYGFLAMMLLPDITGENPVPTNHESESLLMLKDWTEWAEGKGIEPMLDEFDRQFTL